MPAGYRLYGASPADFVGSGTVGSPLIIATAPLEVWDSLVGGAQVTDLLDATEAPVAVITPDDFGTFRFYAPDAEGTLWITIDGSTRYAVQPSDLGDRVGDATDAVAAAEAAAASAAAAQVIAEDLQATFTGHNHNLSDLADVDAADRADGYVLVWDESSSTHLYEAQTGDGGSHTETLATAPAGSTFTINYYDNVFSAVNTFPSSRPSSRTDIYFVWRGPVDPGAVVGAHDDVHLVGPPSA